LDQAVFRPVKTLERFFRECKDRITKHPRFAGAFLGSSPKDAPENRGGRAIPIEDFLSVVDQEMHALSARSGRRSKVCAGRSFQETFDQSYKVGPVTKATPKQRRLCLLAVQNVRVNKDTSVFTLFGNSYHSAISSSVAGQLITVPFDPQALHSAVYVCKLSGEVLGEAERRLANGLTIRVRRKRWRGLDPKS
jgi:putative transposase